MLVISILQSLKPPQKGVLKLKYINDGTENLPLNQVFYSKE